MKHKMYRLRPNQLIGTLRLQTTQTSQAFSESEQYLVHYNQSIIRNVLKSTLKREFRKLLSELKFIHSAGRLFHIFTTRISNDLD